MAKGLSFELEVYNMINTKVQKEEFGWKKDFCKVYHKKRLLLQR